MDLSFNSNMTQDVINNTRAKGKISSMAGASNAKTAQEAKKAGEDFEAFFITQMMEHMYSGIDTDSMFGGGHAEKVYRSMLFSEYGKLSAKTGMVGIAQDVSSAIIDMQEKRENEQLASQKLDGLKQYSEGVTAVKNGSLQ